MFCYLETLSRTRGDFHVALEDVIVSTVLLSWRSVITEVLLKASAVSSEAEAHGGDVVITVARTWPVILCNDRAWQLFKVFI